MRLKTLLSAMALMLGLLASATFSYAQESIAHKATLSQEHLNSNSNAVPISIIPQDVTFTVTYSVVGDYGDLSAYVDFSYISSGTPVAAGSDIEFYAGVFRGFAVKEWTVNGEVVEDNNQFYYYYSNIQEDIVVTVEFMEFTYAEIEPYEQFFSLSEPNDVNFNIIWGDETSIDGITYGYWDDDIGEWIEVELVEGNDYTVVDDVLTIKADFILSLNPEPFDWLSFEVTFGSGMYSYIYIVAVQSVNPTFSPNELEYDLSNPTDLFTFIIFTDAEEVVSISHDGTDLVDGSDYHIDMNKLFIHDSFLSTLLEEVNDEIVLTVEFDNGYEATLTITSIESGITNATIDPSSITFYWHEFPSFIDINITWNDATDVTGLLVAFAWEFGVEYFEWDFFQVTDNGDGTGVLRIFFDEDKAAMLKQKAEKVSKEEEYENYVIQISFDEGAPANFFMTLIYEFYNVIATVVPENSGYVYGAYDYAPDEEVELWAEPNFGYAFVQWEDMEGNVLGTNQEYTFLMPKNDVEVVARFVEANNVYFSVWNDYGTLEATVNGVEIFSGNAVANGSTVVFTAMPDEGYMVGAWYLNSDLISDFTDLTLVVEDLSESINVGVEFVEIPEGYHLVTYSVLGGNGTLTATVDEDAIASGEAVEEGSDVVFTAEPTEGYRVKAWTLNGSLVDDLTEETFTVEGIDENIHVTVEFEWIPVFYTVTFSVVEAGGTPNGTLTASVGGAAIDSGNEVLEGENVVFTATPSEGFIVKEWKLNNVVVDGHTALTYTVTNLMDDVDVKVEFDIEVSAIAPSLAQLRAYPNPFSNHISITDANKVNRVIITNLIGQQVMNVTLNGQETINTSQLNSGVYLVTFEGINGERVVRRMIKK